MGERRDPGLALAPPELAWHGMVRWYDPLYLSRHAKQILFRPTVGSRAERRRALAAGRDLPGGDLTPGHPGPLPGGALPRFFDYRTHAGRDPDGALWIDYVSDTGDGWDPTYTVARGIGAARLAVGGPPGSGDQDVTLLPRASLLVFGGDEVYPVGSPRSYEERLVAPFAAAVRDLADGDPHPDVFAVPGNHDWYDDLVAFSRTFLSGRWFAHWRTVQDRSYFALRLPGRWWLLGTDLELGGDIDDEQLAYFEAIASCMDDDDRVILCIAEPLWIAHAPTPAPARGSNLEQLEARVLGDRTWVHLAGDLHHYRRHTCPADGRVKITAGGGGAFAHPTHTNLGRIATLTDEIVDERGHEQARIYELAAGSCFPPRACSRRIVLQNLLPLGIVWRQPLFFLVPAVLYLLTSLLIPLDLVWGGGAASRSLLEQGGAIVWIGAILAGFLALTDLRPLPARIAAGLAHAAVHLGAVLLCAWLAARWTPALDPRGSGPLPLRSLLVFALGGALGSTIFGWYLAIMCELFGVHENGATATQGCPHWKSFLRLRIGPDGDLTIHPIGIARTPRWRPRGYRAGADAGAAVPRDGRQGHEIYRHIEPPVVIPSRPSRPAGG